MYNGFPISIEKGIINIAQLGLLTSYIQERKNILIVGTTGSGKTSLLSDLIRLIRPPQKIGLWEISPEINTGENPVLHKKLTPNITLEELTQVNHIVIDELRADYINTKKSFIEAIADCHGIASFNKKPFESVENTFERFLEGLNKPSLVSIDIIVEIIREKGTSIYNFGIKNNNFDFVKVL